MVPLAFAMRSMLTGVDQMVAMVVVAGTLFLGPSKT